MKCIDDNTKTDSNFENLELNCQIQNDEKDKESENSEANHP